MQFSEIGEYKYHMFGLKINGYLPFQSDKQWLQFIYTYIYSPIMLTISSIYFALSMAVQLFLANNRTEFMDNIFLTSTCCQSVLKGLVASAKRKYLFQMIKISRELNSMITDKRDIEIMIKCEQLNRKIHLAYLICFMISGLTCCIPPLFSKKKILVMSAYFPVDWQHNDLTYWIIYVYQSLSINFMCAFQSVADTFCGLQLLILNGYLRVLANRFQKPMRNMIKRKSKSHEDADVIELEKCLKFYDLLDEYRYCIEEAHGYILFLQFIITGLAQCSSAILLSQQSMEMSKKTFLMSYIVSVTLEIFLPCMAGTLVMYESGYLNTKIFHSDWYKRSPLYLKNLKIVRERFLKPFYVKLTGHFILGLSNFLTILNGSYSVFAVLQNYN